MCACWRHCLWRGGLSSSKRSYNPFSWNWSSIIHTGFSILACSLKMDRKARWCFLWRTSRRPLRTFTSRLRKEWAGRYNSFPCIWTSTEMVCLYAVSHWLCVCEGYRKWLKIAIPQFWVTLISLFILCQRCVSLLFAVCAQIWLLWGFSEKNLNPAFTRNPTQFTRN